MSAKAVPHIVTNEDAQEEANRQNVFRLACVGAKEQMAKKITAKVAANITKTPFSVTRTESDLKRWTSINFINLWQP